MKGKCGSCKKENQILNNITELCKPCLMGKIMARGIVADQVVYIPKSEEAKWDAGVESLTGKKPTNAS